MRSPILFILLVCVLGNQPIFCAALKLNEALQTKKVSYTIHGNSSSTHYLEPIILEVLNTSNEPISIAIEDGDMFIPTDSAKQNIVVTSSDVLVLQPKDPILKSTDPLVNPQKGLTQFIRDQ